MRTEDGDLAISFSLTPKECRAGAQRQVLRHPQGRIVLIGAVVFIVTGLAMGLTWLVVFGVGCFSFVGIVVAFAPQLDPKRLRTVHTMAFNPDVISMSDGVVEGRAPWSVFKRFDETTDLFLLTLRLDGQVAIVPKRAFDTPAEVDQFRDLARLALDPG